MLVGCRRHQNQLLDQRTRISTNNSPTSHHMSSRHSTATNMAYLLKHAAVATALSTTAAVVLAQDSSSTATATATACPTVLSPSYSAPVVGPGWTSQLVARNLTSPRSILFDTDGALLVVQKGAGILRVRFDDLGGTCLVVNSTAPVVEDADVSCVLCCCCERG